MIFLDANVPMYVVGTDPVAAARASALIARLSTAGEAIVTSAEVLQEILHRYRAIDRTGAVQQAFDLVGVIADEVYPVDRADVERARDIMLARAGTSARDCVHVATMERRGIARIASFDRDFDAFPDIERLA